MAEVSLTEAHQIYARVGRDIGTAALLRCLEQEHDDQSRLAEAELCFDRANEIYARTASNLDRVNKLTGLGVIIWTLFENRDVEASFEPQTSKGVVRTGGICEETFSEVLRIYAQIGHPQGQANALRSLGEVYQCQSNYSAAQTFLAQAERIYALIGDGPRQGSMLVRLGDILYRQSKYA
ncbi:hypothetical protein FRB90_001794 [Tulasnella sp. 427]|nr:hypothetical protein FRB90_001794 [Tulasnella sp. 427]